MMNFRQRISWLLIFVYLAVTFGLVYYIFELSDQYTLMAIEHTRLYHSGHTASSGVLHSVWNHLADVPFGVWIIILAVPYFQVFFVLFLCTRSDPGIHLATCLIPVVGCLHVLKEWEPCRAPENFPCSSHKHKPSLEENGQLLSNGKQMGLSIG